MSSLESRVELLEKQNRMYRRCLILGGVLLCAFAAMGSGGQGVQDKVQAKVIEIVDANNKVLVRLGALDGMGTVSTYTPSGEFLCDIVPSKGGGGGIVVYDGKGKQNVIVTDVTNGGGSIRLNNSKGNPCLSLGRNTEDAGSFQVMTSGGAKVLHGTADTAGVGVLTAQDSAGKQVARFPVDAADPVR